MAPQKKLKLIRVRTGTTYDHLAAMENKPRITRRPATLALHDIHVADRVFQRRLPDENLVEDEKQVRELVRVLGDAKPLDPILVTAIGDRFYCVDGHHRIDAYQTVRWKRPVPVEYFEGTLRQAWEEALERNSKNKLPMTNNAKLQAAWEMVLLGGYKHERIRELSSVSLRTIGTMRRVLKAFGDEARKLLWASARRLGDDNAVPSGEDWKEAKAKKMAEQIFRNVGPGIVADADITAMALALVDPTLPERLIAEWWSLVRDMQDARDLQDYDL